MDISWDEVAKYAAETPEAVKRTAEILNKIPFDSALNWSCSVQAMKRVGPSLADAIFSANLASVVGASTPWPKFKP